MESYRLSSYYASATVNWGWNKNIMNNFSVPSVTASVCIKTGMQINLLPVSFISVLGMGDSVAKEETFVVYGIAVIAWS